MRPALLALLAALLGCGAPGPADPAPPGTSEPAPDEPAPPGSPGGAEDGGGSGAGGAGASAPSAAFERLDVSGDCAGLVPDAAAAAPPVLLDWTPPAGGSCEGGLTDGTGHVAVSARLPSGVTWRFHAPAGDARGTAAAETLSPQPDGFHGLRVSPGPREDAPLVEHVALGPGGDARSATPVSGDPALEAHFAWSYAADPAGGGAVIFQSVNLQGNHWFVLRTSRFGAGGEPGVEGARVATDQGPGPIFRASGVSRSGEQLALWQQSAFVSAAWLDRAGAEVASATWDAGDPAEVAIGDARYAPHALALAPLLDGGLALRVDGGFRRAYAPRAGRSVPLPAWLAERAAASFRFTRGNAGYAVFRPGAGTSAGDCARRVELVSPSGRLCGRAVLPAPGGACEPGVIDQGWDGSVVEQVAPGACTWRVWPRLLAR